MTLPLDRANLVELANCAVAVELSGIYGPHVMAFDALHEAFDLLFDGLHDGGKMPLTVVVFRYPAPPRIITQEVVDELEERQREREIDERHKQARRFA